MGVTGLDMEDGVQKEVRCKSGWGCLMEEGHHPEGESSDADKLIPGGPWVMHTAHRSS